MLHKTIDEFKQLLQAGGGLSSPTRYAVEALLPGNAKSGLTWHPESITLPSRSFASVVDTVFGPVRQFPHRRQYNSEIVMSFTSSNSQGERLYFEGWMDKIIDKNNRINTSILNNLDNNMWIYVLSHSDVPTGTFSLDGVYPTSIIPANYGYNMINEYATFQVTFRYRDYTFDEGYV